VEVITAQTALVQAEINNVQALYNFYTADARLTRSLGQADRIGRGATK
jgi:outer membrane protein TolC